jgi:3-oxoacyl-[acyl-carrier protein] reductase
VNEAGGRETVQRVTEAGSEAIFVATDVTRRDHVRRFIGAGLERFGRIEFLLNAAGSALQRCTFLEIDDALWDLSFDLNVNGAFYGMQEVLPHMLGNGGGTIVNIASMAHKRGGPGTSVHYASAKGAVVTMTLGVAREFASRGIRCLSISPASVDTAFQSASGTSSEQAQRALNSIPMKRIATADEIGELVLFMCSDACQFMTADTVYVSGGGGFR